jgi:hypothetical protein
MQRGRDERYAASDRLEPDHAADAHAGDPVDLVEPFQNTAVDAEPACDPTERHVPIGPTFEAGH